jgi:hypothetical protein
VYEGDSVLPVCLNLLFQNPHQSVVGFSVQLVCPAEMQDLEPSEPADSQSPEHSNKLGGIIGTNNRELRGLRQRHIGLRNRQTHQGLIDFDTENVATLRQAFQQFGESVSKTDGRHEDEGFIQKRKLLNPLFNGIEGGDGGVQIAILIP